MTHKRTTNDILGMCDLNTYRGKILKLLADGTPKTVAQLILKTGCSDTLVRKELKELMESHALCTIRRRLEGGIYRYQLSVMRMNHSEYMRMRKTQKGFDDYSEGGHADCSIIQFLSKTLSGDDLVVANRPLGR